MKKITNFVSILIFVLCSVLNIFAQTEFSRNIVDTTKQWNIVEYGLIGAQTMAYRIMNEDTIINNKTYNRIQRSFAYTPMLQEWNEWQGMGWIREEDNKVFIFPEEYYDEPISKDIQEEYLLYDFSLQTGDSVNLYREGRFLLTDYRDNGMMSFYVVSTDSIEIGSIKCKRLFLSRDKNRNTPSEIWIEGIGSNTGFLESTCSYYEHLRNLLCVKQNEEVMYYNGDNTCYISVSIDDIDNTNAKIYPTLVKDNIYVVSDNNKPMDISFVNISGHIVKTIRTKGSKEIDISSLPSGIYNVIINNTHSQKIIKL
ncbi:MAG: T9SS type A sorting domain-containing protein [Bacteroidales bacterium]|nr:T9SS type A sorting domain-containing protein [Bacteroidales bacterium]